MKRIFSIFLAMVVLLAAAAPASAAQLPEVSPYYTNATKATVNLTISNSGNATIKVTCSGKSNVTKITAKTYLEIKVNTTWLRIDLGTTDNTWTDTVYSNYMSVSHTKQVRATGEYRAVTVFTVVADTTEVITASSVDTY